MSRVELGVIVAVSINIIGFAFWCGTLNGRIGALEEIDPSNDIATIKQRIADLQRQVGQLESGALEVNDLTLRSLTVKRNGNNVLTFWSTDQGGRITIFDAGGQERGEIRVEQFGKGVTYKSNATDDTTHWWNATESTLVALPQP